MNFISHSLVFVLMLMSAVSSSAQTTPKPSPSFAVVSEVGHGLQIVGFKEQTGTRLDNNLRQRIETPGGSLDKAVLLTAQKALNSAVPGAPVYLVSPLDVLLFPAAGNPVVGTRLKLPDDLAAVLKEQGATQLVLINPRSGDASFQALHNRVGSGRIDGLGFYVERTTQMLNVDTGESASGFLATFSYVNVSLLDARDGRVLATQPLTESRLDIASISAQGGHPWDSVGNAEKMANLLTLLQDAVARTVPLVVETRK